MRRNSIINILFIGLMALTFLSVQVKTGFASQTVTIQDFRGDVEVPIQPERVISLDNRTFETLANWNIPLLAVPKEVMPADSPYVKDNTVENIGNHREPQLELIAALNPDLVIIGQRFASYYDEIKQLVPHASVIDLSWPAEGEQLFDDMKKSTTILGQIFQQEDEAHELIDNFDHHLAEAKEAYSSNETVLAVIVSGKGIGYSAPGNGRVWGPLFDLMEWTPALEVSHTSTDHKGDDISLEAITAANPDWLMVLDRDAAISQDQTSQPAKALIENSQTLQKTKAVRNNQVVYAPADTYTNESLETYIELFQTLTEKFSNS